ncbi:MAG: methylenetetrahydrofolate reductase [NAD(P)H] [bacterium]|nr:methylenetetrahydrofolate reductase [NAD(P)H] [bacterium]
MTLANIYQADRIGLSFELFPPKTEKGESALLRHVEKLVAFDPDYVTCTYGAGGSTRDKTLEIISNVKAKFNKPVASHLTVVGSTVDELRSYLKDATDANVEYIVALRGDPPQGQTNFQPVEGGLRYANELVDLIRAEFPNFGVAVAGYPETHQEAVGPEVDLENLKRKVDAGADVVITQLFYNNEDFFEFRERYEAAGIKAPLVPGILPVTNLSQIERIASLCGARLPSKFVDKLGEKDDTDWQFEVGIEFAIEQIRELRESSVPGLHFYVLNKSQATSRVLQALSWETTS